MRAGEMRAGKRALLPTSKFTASDGHGLVAKTAWSTGRLELQFKACALSQPGANNQGCLQGAGEGW